MNLAYIYQPHFKTDCFRVAIKDQQGPDYNYVVVTCSPQYNGIYKYPMKNIKDKHYTVWYNNKTPCICVPIKDCEKVKELTEITNNDILKKVKRQQQMWYKSEVENRDYQYVNKPEWML